jgi:hypothetical protein
MRLCTTRKKRNVGDTELPIKQELQWVCEAVPQVKSKMRATLSTKAMVYQNCSGHMRLCTHKDITDEGDAELHQQSKAKPVGRAGAGR